MPTDGLSGSPGPDLAARPSFGELRDKLTAMGTAVALHNPAGRRVRYYPPKPRPRVLAQQRRHTAYGRPRSRRGRGTRGRTCRATRATRSSGDTSRRTRTRRPADEYVGALGWLWRHSDRARLPAHVVRFAERAGLDPLDQVRFCALCGIVAFAIDDFERDQLDRLGFYSDVCPDCRAGRYPR